MRNILALLTLSLILSACGPEPLPQQSGPPAALHQSSVVAPAAPNLVLDSADWRQEFVQWPGTQGALELEKLTINPTAPGCPAGNVCEPFPDRNATPANFMSYLLYELPTASAPELSPKVTANSGILAYKAITFKIEVDASPGTVFRWDSEPLNHGTTPAHIRPVLVYSGFRTADRWWAHAPGDNKPGYVDSVAYQIAPGVVTITVPLDPSYWVDVFGHPATSTTPEKDNSVPAAGFQTTLANPQYVGLGFGGGSFYDHGVAVSGSAEFKLLQYSFK